MSKFCSHIYYLPFYFQAIKDTSAVGSGVRTIPYLVSITLASIVIGAFITVTGNYADFLWVGSLIYVAGCASISTLNVNSNTGKWLGFQLLSGIGAGAAVQVPFLAVQVALKPELSPVGSKQHNSRICNWLFMTVSASIVLFFNSLGGAIAISIAQNVFSNRLLADVPKFAPSVDPNLVLNTGATQLKNVIPPAVLGDVLQAYAKALDTTFIPPIAFAGVTFFIALGVSGRSFSG